MLNRLKEHIKSANLFSETDRLLVAVSGGIDSMVLASILSQLGFCYAVAHVDHNTREGESALDKAFVNDYFNKQCIKVHHLDYRHRDDGNFHDAAHKARYLFFRQLDYDKILTAHHKDDQIETILVNIFNGRSMESMPEIHDKVVRPLLPFRKKELLLYAKKYGIAFREDTSNFKNSYLRNVIRNSILPLLDEQKDLGQKILNLSLRNAKDIELLKLLVKEKVALEKVNGGYELPLNQFNNQSPDFIFHALGQFGINRSQAADLEKMLDKVGKELITATYRILVDREKLLISPLSEFIQEPLTVALSSTPFQLSYGAFTIVFSLVEVLPANIKPTEAYFPMSLLDEQLVLRPWKEGDAFYPYGMGGKRKKLKDLFTDMKVDRITKSKLPIVLSKDEIIWVPTLRSDNRFQVKETDREILRIELIS